MSLNKRTIRRRLPVLAGTLLMAAAPAGAAVAAHGGTMDAPATAAVGQTISVHATGLNPPGGYSLTLTGGTPPNKNSFCTDALETEKPKTAAFTFTVKIPRTIKCWSGYPASRAGSTKVTPGRYQLRVQYGEITGSGCCSFIKREIKITG